MQLYISEVVLHWWGWKCQGSMYFCYDCSIHCHFCL